MRKKFFILLAILIVFFVIGAAIYYCPPLYSLYKHNLLAQENLEQAAKNLQEKNFFASREYLNNFQSEVGKIRQDLSRLKTFQSVPIIRDNYQALNQLTLAAISLGAAGQELMTTAEKILPLISANETYEQFSEPEKEQFLKELYQATPILQGVKANLEIANLNLQNLPSKNLLPPIAEATNLVDKYFPLLVPALDLLSSGIQTLPYLAGYGQEKTYLVVMQNNDELRPTGGFIGTFGILKIKNGSILSLTTDDSYALDRQAEEYLSLEPPQPIKEYLTTYWWFRDANWSPDFPTAAQKLIWFYQQEGGKERIDGVIAVDPEVISKILSVTGPLAIYELVLNPQNFSDILQYEVEQNYYEREIDKTQRKDIIGKLGNILIKKLAELPAKKWLEIFSLADQSLKEKHILLYDQNEILQKTYLANNWSGEVKNMANDYLLVVDANMAALKTDRVVDKKIHYSIEEDSNDNLIATVTLNYQNNGQYDYRTTRLRDYIRLYVPAGSQLLKVEGAMANDRTKDKQAVAKIDFGQELNKTVFGTFWYINPGESRELIFKYQLPSGLKEQIIKDKQYNLFIQKQPGTTGHSLKIEVKLGGLTKTIETDLSVDRQIEIKL